MIVCQFNLSSSQIQTLVTFRVEKDSRLVESHPFSDVDGSHTIVTMKKLCREGYLQWHPADVEKNIPPGYTITSKGEMMLRVVEDELRRNLGWFTGEPLPKGQIQGAQHDLAAGKSEVNSKGKIRRKKIA